MSSPPPETPKAFHITHVKNLQNIAASGYLFSDSYRIEHGLNNTNIGITGIKESRLTRPVTCNPGTSVGEYVPFYFCPRSVMLYILHRGNHSQLSYQEGQEPVVHLQFDVRALVQWANQLGKLWAFSDRNAATRYASFHNSLAHLNEINWDAVGSNNFSAPEIKDGKQAELLVYERAPWTLIEGIGVFNNFRKNQVATILGNVDYVPPIAVKSSWYY